MVVCAGETVAVPVKGNVCPAGSTDGEIENDVPFVTCHEIVVDWPWAMLAGWALMAITACEVGVGEGVGVGLGPGLPLPTPPQPVKTNKTTQRRNIRRTRKDSDLGMAISHFWEHAVR